MIRRISKHNDLRDIIKSCPSGVIDDIYAIEYYIQGNNVVINASFTQVGNELVVVLPTSQLELLPNGILMRRAFYKVQDSSYPDGYYNLEFEDNMNIWLGDYESEEPVIPEYVTEDELAETLDGYVTEETLEETLDGYVTSETFHGAFNALDTHINAVENSLSGYVTDQTFGGFVNNTESRFQDIDAHLQYTDDRVTALEQSPGGVSQEQFAAHVAANNESFNILQGVTQDNSQRIRALENAVFATQQDLDAVARHIDDVDNKADDIQNQVDGLAQDVQNQIDGLDQRVTDLEQEGGGGSWGSITGDIADQQDLMDEFNLDRGRLDDLENGTLVPTGIATESWVQNQGYLTSSDLSGYATETWVQNQGYLTSNSTLPASQITCNISGDVFDFDDVDEGLSALVSRVEDQMDDITSLDTRVTDIENAGYATQTWATNQFLEESKVWSGTEAQWNALTPAQQASYTIALITQ